MVGFVQGRHGKSERKERKGAALRQHLRLPPLPCTCCLRNASMIGSSIVDRYISTLLVSSSRRTRSVNARLSPGRVLRLRCLLRLPPLRAPALPLLAPCLRTAVACTADGLYALCRIRAFTRTGHLPYRTSFAIARLLFALLPFSVCVVETVLLARVRCGAVCVFAGGDLSLARWLANVDDLAWRLPVGP
jgi:hypothetical protein